MRWRFTAQIASGGERNRYYVCDDGIIRNEGSSSASETFVGYYKINQDLNLELVEVAICDYNTNFEKPWFYNTSNPTMEGAEELSEERFNEINNKCKYTKITYEPLDSYKK